MLRNRFLVAAIAASLALSACARPDVSPATSAPAATAQTLDKLADGYEATKGFAVLLLPYVSTARAARIRLALDLVGIAIARARAAQGAERDAQLRKVIDAQAQLDAAIDST